MKTRILRSILVLLSCVRCHEEVAVLVVDYGSGMSSLVLLVSSHLELCSRRLLTHGMEKYAQAAEQFFIGSLDNNLADTFSSLDVARVDFLGALDDEEFFVVESSGGGGVARSLDSQVFCHQLVSVTAFCIDRCGVTIHTHQVVSQTITTIIQSGEAPF